MRDKGIKFESDREDPFDALDAELFGGRERKWAVLIVLVGCALGAVAVVLWR